MNKINLNLLNIILIFSNYKLFILAKSTNYLFSNILIYRYNIDNY